LSRFEMRALEVHSNLVWNFDHLRRALDFMGEQGMNTLVLHRNDIVDLIVYPGVFFGASRESRNIFERYQQIYQKLYKYTPTRRSGPYQRRDYLQRVFEVAERRGIEVIFENKELYFPDVLLELYPELVQGGTTCPNQPLWWDFLKTKYTELFQEFPRLKGIITAPGTGESRVAISSNRCECELCQQATPRDWYISVLDSMYQPIKAAERTLAVRDFVFDKKAQTELAAAFAALPADVVISLKNTPHDYYPTFPDNPRIGDVGTHRQWIEFDTMGQYFGWGVAPAIIIDDYRRRLDYAEEKGASGVIFRTDWESLDGHTVFHNFNLINLYAGAALANGSKARNTDFYRTWLKSEKFLNADATDVAIDEAASWAEKLLADSWAIVAGALYVNSCVFNDSSNYPVSLDHAWWLAEVKNSLKDWDPTKTKALETSRANVEAILAEKSEAVKTLERSLPVLETKPDALSEDAYAWIRANMTAAHLYVRGWEAVGRACILTRQALDHPDDATVTDERIEAALHALLAISGEIRLHEKQSDLHFVAYVAMGWERLEVLHADLQKQLSGSRTDN